MSLYVYAPVIYPGTKQFLDAMQAKRLVKHDGMSFTNKGKPITFDKSDVIICWGHHVPPAENALTINGSHKFHDQVSMNFKLNKVIPELDGTVYGLPWHKMDIPRYTTALNALKKHGQVNRAMLMDANNLVPVKEHPPYVLAYYDIKETHKVLVVGNVVIGDIPESYGKAAVQALHYYGLDFGLFTVCDIGYTNVRYIRKLTTTPTLPADQLAQFRNVLTAYIESKRS